jgi:hypothetical protein
MPGAPVDEVTSPSLLPPPFPILSLLPQLPFPGKWPKKIIFGINSFILLSLRFSTNWPAGSRPRVAQHTPPNGRQLIIISHDPAIIITPSLYRSSIVRLD